MIALGNGLTTPSLPGLRVAPRDRHHQGLTLGALQSAAALARAAGPLVGGALYAAIDPRAPYLRRRAGLAAAGAAGAGARSARSQPSLPTPQGEETTSC